MTMLPFPANAATFDYGIRWRLISILALAFLGLTTEGFAFGVPGELVPPTESFAGKSQREWSLLWWQWAASFEYEDSPVADRTGEKCTARQDGDVWFLAGTYGTKRTVRTCTVPAGKHLFFPLINYAVIPRGANAPSCAEVTRKAANMTENVSMLVLEVDGKRFNMLESHRQATDRCFDAGVKSTPPQKAFPSAANGYYIMLRPLERGTHIINFGGALPSMLQAVTYTLVVE